MKTENIKLIIDKCIELDVVNVNQIAYVLATVHHETNQTFKPVKEAYWLSETWRKENLYYYPYYGRGFSQITHERNYQVFEDLLGVPLVSEPNLALDFETSLEILVTGMSDGLFTGRKLSRYINDSKTDFKNARRIINGKDKAQRIATLAEPYVVLVEIVLAS